MTSRNRLTRSLRLTRNAGRWGAARARDTDRALSRLDQAAAVGWRGYYAIRYDPRWDTVREDPRFVRIMARVKAEIDVERARMEQINAREDFMARLGVAVAARAAEVRPPNDGIRNR
jgi:hypothetical protein